MMTFNTMLVSAALLTGKALAVRPTGSYAGQDKLNDPCFGLQEKACEKTPLCQYTAEDHHNFHRLGRKDRTKEGHYGKHSRQGCAMMHVVDRMKEDGFGNGEATNGELKHLADLGFHSNFKDMTCQEAFFKEDCKHINTNSDNRCSWTCDNTDVNMFEESCKPTPEGGHSRFNSCGPYTLGMESCATGERAGTFPIDHYDDTELNVFSWNHPIFEGTDFDPKGTEMQDAYGAVNCVTQKDDPDVFGLAMSICLNKEDCSLKNIQSSIDYAENNSGWDESTDAYTMFIGSFNNTKTDDSTSTCSEIGDLNIGDVSSDGTMYRSVTNFPAMKPGMTHEEVCNSSKFPMGIVVVTDITSVDLSN